MSKLAELRSRIPTFACIEGCTDCCRMGGSAMWTAEERENVPDLRHERPNVCPFVTEVGCGCYEDRPIICRLFGTTSEGPGCPHGRGSEVRLSISETVEIVKAWHEMGPKLYLKDRVVGIEEWK